MSVKTAVHKVLKTFSITSLYLKYPLVTPSSGAIMHDACAVISL